jgi:hypothetical protein
MPIRVHIDLERRVVFARAVGVLTDDDIFSYQRSVWSRPEVAGFDELWDAGSVERIALPSADRVRDLAVLAASMDAPETSSRLAIVATTDFAYGLGRMFEMHRESDTKSRKEVNVFRSRAEALRWLGIEDGGESAGPFSAA